MCDRRTVHGCFDTEVEVIKVGLDADGELHDEQRVVTFLMRFDGCVCVCLIP
jgi:hypothetical protein